MAEPLPVGTFLKNGTYQIQEVRGSGGFGITYRATDTKKRDVAIKELCPRLCQRVWGMGVDVIREEFRSVFSEVKERFLNECQILRKLAGLQHRNIVQVYDYFSENNTAYLVMEYLHGETLAEMLGRVGMLSERQAIEYILQVCDALELVHRNGYVHRDIKPGNIFLCKDGRVVLLDFGGAREFERDSSTTTYGFGTEVYAAPEQFIPRSRRRRPLDQRTDIYGLAATLYHSVTGRAPWPAYTRKECLQEKQPDMPHPHTIQQSVSEELSKIIMWGLDLEIENRPQDVTVLKQWLQTLLSRHQDENRADIWGWGRFHGGRFLPDGTFLSILCADAHFVQCMSFSPDGSILASGGQDGTIKLWSVSGRALMRTLTGHRDWVMSVSFSPDGRLLASAGGDGTVRLWCVHDDLLQCTLRTYTLLQCTLRTYTRGGVGSVSFSPDGSTLASGSEDGTIKLWSVSDGTLRRTLTGHTYWVTSVSFSPDGSTLASGSEDGTIKLWSVSDGTLMRTLWGHDSWATSVSFSPDGSTLASGIADGTVLLWNLENGLLMHRLIGHEGMVRSLSFSPDGSILASGGKDGTIKLWSVLDGTLMRTLTGHTYWVASVSFSPNGRLLASGGKDRTVRLWRLG